MSIAKILVPVNGTAQDVIAIATAIRAAKPFNAHVSAVFVHPTPAEALFPIGIPLTGEAMQAVIDGQTEFMKAAAKAARAILRRVCVGERVELVDVPELREAVTCSFRERTGPFATMIAELASLSDLVVFGQPSHSSQTHEAILEVLLNAQRPVLLASQAPARLFHRVAVGWDGGQCAANATFAAMPYLERAQYVEVISIDHGQSNDLQDVKDYLKLHSISCLTRNLRADHQPIHETLMTRVDASHADTLVIGGYGHSRVRETFFGGVTIEMLLRARMPVFLMH